MGIRFTAYEKQIAELRQQVAQVDDLKAEINELRERLGQNPCNSSKPPSTDPPSSKAKSSSEPGKRRKRGAQPGHQGKARTLKPATGVDQVVDLKPLSGTQCGRGLRGHDEYPERHQVSEVASPPVILTEYRRHTLRCQNCGVWTRADRPSGMPRGSSGPRAQALTGHFTGRPGLPHRDTAEALQVLHGLDVGLGSIAPVQRYASAALSTG